MDRTTPVPELLLVDTGDWRSPAGNWWILGVVAAVALGVAAIMTAKVDQVTPRVEVTSDGVCDWSGAVVSTGLVEIEFVNNYREAVWMKFAPIVEEAPIEDVIVAAATTGDLHTYENMPFFVGRGQNTRPVEPGTTVSFNVGLTSPGHYAVSCSTTEPTFAAGAPTIATEALHVVSAS